MSAQPFAVSLVSATGDHIVPFGERDASIDTRTPSPTLSLAMAWAEAAVGRYGWCLDRSGEWRRRRIMRARLYEDGRLIAEYGLLDRMWIEFSRCGEVVPA